MAKPVALITGIAGFAGSWLSEELLNEGFEVAGSMLPTDSRENLHTIEKSLSLEYADILDSSQCRKLVATFEPDYIFHLAAIASVGRSFEMEQITFRVNFEGTLNMLDAARQDAKLRKFVFVGSADAYGVFTPKTKTLAEQQCFNPISPYGIAKAAAEYAARYYHRAHGLPVAVARSFNHSGPRQIDNFAIPSFAKQIAMIEAGMQPAIIQVGDLSTRRDFSDVRDIVRGYRLLAEKGKPGEAYQLCSGKAVSVQKVLDTLLSLSSTKIRVHVDKSRLRKADIPILRGSHQKATRELGWEPIIPLKATLQDTVAYWRDKIDATERQCKKQEIT